MILTHLTALLKRPANLLALGIFALALGAISAMFGAMDAMLFRPLSYQNADRLVSMFDVYPDWGGQGSISIPSYVERKAEIPELENAALYRGIAANLVTDAADPAARALRLNGTIMTPSFFATVGWRPVLGRGFTEADVAAPNQLVVLSHDTWQKHFAADPLIIGKSIQLQGDQRVVIGVLAPEHISPNRDLGDDFYFAVHFDAEDLSVAAREYNHWNAIGLMREGVQPSTIAAKSSALFARYAKSMGETRWRQFVDQRQYSAAQPIRHRIFGDSLQHAQLLLWALFGVLIIACANVANLLSTQVVERTREFAVRAALGAPRQQLIQKIVMEGAFVALIGALLGIALAHWLQPLLMKYLLGGAVAELGTSWRVLLVMSLIGVLSGMLASLLSAFLAVRQSVSVGLRSASRSSSAGGDMARFRRYLSALQIGMAFALLAAALCLVRDFQALERIDNGFNPNDVHTMRVSLNGKRYQSDAARNQFLEQMRLKLGELPQVAAVSLSQHLPFNGDNWGSSFSSDYNSDEVSMRMVLVGPGFFDAMRVPLKAGRDFRLEDSPNGAADASAASQPLEVVIIDEQAAQKLFGSTDVIGKVIRRDDGNLQVIGLAGNVQRDEPGVASALGSVYFPLTQLGGTGEIQIALRMQPDALPAVNAVRLSLAQLDPNLALFDVRTLDSMRADKMMPQRLVSRVSGTVALFALLLAAVGTFGVLAFAMSARRVELAVRQAVGASPMRLVRLVMLDTARLLAIGLVIGVPLWFAIQQLIQGQLKLVPAFDPPSALIAIAAIALSGLLACAIPAWRARSTEPVIAMRSE
jgi:predicted permease